MDKLPIELHQEIFELACLDDGSTGCALSAVSQYIRQTSADCRYRCIALTDTRQLRLFHELVTRYFQYSPVGRPIDVRHLYVSLQAHRIRLPLGPAMWEELGFRPGLIDDILSPLLAFVQDSLETLTIVVPRALANVAVAVLTNSGQPSLTFPRLQELTLCGNVMLPYQRTDFARRLKRLHLVFETFIPWNWVSVTLQMGHFAELTHLRISFGSDPRTAAHLSLRDAREVLSMPCLMGILSREDGFRLSAKYQLSIPTATGEKKGQLLIVQPVPSTRLALNRIVQNDPAIFNKANDSFIIVPVDDQHPNNYRYALMKIDWIDRLDGGPGCWVSEPR